MNVVNIKDIIIGDKIGQGASGEVRKCTFDGNQYCIKIINKTYPKSVITNIKNMTSQEFSKEYFVPLFVVENSSGDFLHYLMNFDEKLLQATKIKELRDKLIFLKNAREIIHKLHRKFKRIHGDLVLENMLYNKLLNAFLVDFDSSLDFGKEYEDKQTVRLFVQDYLKYYPVDKNMDIYTFNVTTLKMIGNVPRVDILLDDIAEGEFFMFQENKNIKRLTKELLLRDTKKRYSGEYIIDHIMNEFK